MRSKLNFTASALNGVPSWNLTSRRSLKVTLRPSFDVVHDSASQGTSLPSGALNNRHSVTEAMIWYVTAEGEACGSSVGGSCSSPSTRVPPTCGSASRVRTPVTTSPVSISTTTGRSERNTNMTASWAGSITSATSGARLDHGQLGYWTSHPKCHADSPRRFVAAWWSHLGAAKADRGDHAFRESTSRLGRRLNRAPIESNLYTTPRANGVVPGDRPGQRLAARTRRRDC